MFDDRWFMNVLGDLGGWSNSATGQALASVGYNWTQNWSTTLGYRVMYNYEKQDTGFNFLFEAEELPLPAVDVRPVRRGEVQLLRPANASAETKAPARRVNPSAGAVTAISARRRGGRRDR